MRISYFTLHQLRWSWVWREPLDCFQSVVQLLWGLVWVDQIIWYLRPCRLLGPHIFHLSSISWWVVLVLFGSLRFHVLCFSRLVFWNDIIIRWRWSLFGQTFIFWLEYSHIELSAIGYLFSIKVAVTIWKTFFRQCRHDEYVWLIDRCWRLNAPPPGSNVFFVQISQSNWSVISPAILSPVSLWCRPIVLVVEHWRDQQRQGSLVSWPIPVEQPEWLSRHTTDDYACHASNVLSNVTAFIRFPSLNWRRRNTSSAVYEWTQLKYKIIICLHLQPTKNIRIIFLHSYVIPRIKYDPFSIIVASNYSCVKFTRFLKIC